MRAWLAWLALACSAAAAQTVELQPTDAQQCLGPASGAGQLPEYPIAEYNAALAGRVQVRLEFAAADRPPEVTVLLQQGHARFLESVTEHVRHLRVPCMRVGQDPVVLHKDYVFEPGIRQVAEPAAVDPAAERRKAMLGCLIHSSGWRVPEYPTRARRAQIQGRVVVRARYDSATEPPKVEVFYRGAGKELAVDLERWMLNTRLPCHTGEPVTGMWTYVFILDDSRYGFKELSFGQFLGSAKGLAEQTLALDTTTMGCPFDVLLSYRRPQLPNSVKAIGPHHAGREPLLAWMTQAELNLSGRLEEAVFGDTARITIPCVKIDLKPKEKTS